MADHHEQSGGIWLLIAKKGSDKVSVTISDALDVALCYGWIDSQRKRYDTNNYLQRYSARRPGSPWSRLNVERVEALTDAGRMRAPGL
ncbi:MAG TPA: OmdA domain containing protein, partial [Candidatus Dormibacteraeota bacterium]|nr:OmdA domain containing protein [Candidatus Dormibacteraeota bacterium]